MRLADLESVHNDLAVVSGTVAGRNSTVACFHSKNFQLRGKVSRLRSKFESSQALRDEFDLSQWRLDDCEAKTDRLRTVFISVCDLLDGTLAGSDDQS